MLVLPPTKLILTKNAFLLTSHQFSVTCSFAQENTLGCLWRNSHWFPDLTVLIISRCSKPQHLLVDSLYKGVLEHLHTAREPILKIPKHPKSKKIPKSTWKKIQRNKLHLYWQGNVSHLLLAWCPSSIWNYRRIIEIDEIYRFYVFPENFYGHAVFIPLILRSSGACVENKTTCAP